MRITHSQHVLSGTLLRLLAAVSDSICRIQLYTLRCSHGMLSVCTTTGNCTKSNVLHLGNHNKLITLDDEIIGEELSLSKFHVKVCIFVKLFAILKRNID